MGKQRSGASRRFPAIALTAALGLLFAAPWTGSSCTVADASAIDGTVALLCEEGRILMGAPSSDDWRIRPLPAKEELRAVRFLTRERGFVAGEKGALLATGDGGETWREVALDITENLTAIHSIGDRIWVAGWNGTILHSADGGQTWTLQPTSVSSGLDDVYFADERHGWAVGWVGTIIRTTNGGNTWEQVRAPEAKWSVNAVYFRDALHGWAVGFGGQILRSQDGGETWEKLSSPVTTSLTSIYFDSDGRGWITTTDGLLRSDGDGRSWEHIQVANWLFLKGVLEIEGSLWAVGSRGLLKDVGGSRTWARIDDFLPESASLTGS